ncbi:MAG: hypothetical protein KDE27_03050, partial [Planctomycetes bacterium]|nr:hypothetical protein [Planctomycetota bacterium]
DDATGGRRAGFAVGAAGAAQDPAGAPLPGAEVRWRDPRATAGDAPGDDAPLFEQRITRSFAIGDDASFTIDADTGNLLVAAAADGERALRLEIVQRVAASDQEAAARLTRAHRYALEQGEHGVVLRATLDPEAGAARAALRASEFRITVPRGCTTRLETRDGDIVVGGLRSDLQARTHRGGIHLARIDGAVNAEARGGDVVLAEGCSGAVDVLAVQGDAIVAGVVGEANVRASGGNIRLGPSAGRVYAQTSGGDIDVDGVEGATGGFALGGSVAVRIDRAPTANCAFSATGGGDVRLTVGDGVAIDLAARGELASPFPTESVEDDDGNGPPWQVSRLAGGGVRVRLSSSTGRVLVQPGGPQGNGPEGSGPDGSGPSGSGLGGSGLGGSGSGDARPTLTAAARARTSGPPRPGALATVTLPDSAGGIDGYTIYLPPAHATDGDPYPVIVYLQGGYGVGGPIENVNDWGLPRLVRDAGEPATERDHLLLERFVVVALHLTEGQYGEHQETVRQVLADVLASWNGDPARVYLTGLSRGGHGTWELAERLRGTFAAIVPIGGSAEDVEDWDALAGTAIWISHNRGDTIVPFAATADAVANVERQFGVEFRRYDRIDVAGTDYLEQRYVLTAPDVDNHDAWTDLYTRPEIYRWLLAQSRAATAARSYR